MVRPSRRTWRVGEDSTTGIANEPFSPSLSFPPLSFSVPSFASLPHSHLPALAPIFFPSPSLFLLLPSRGSRYLTFPEAMCITSPILTISFYSHYPFLFFSPSPPYPLTAAGIGGQQCQIPKRRHGITVRAGVRAKSHNVFHSLAHWPPPLLPSTAFAFTQISNPGPITVHCILRRGCFIVSFAVA